MHGMEEQKLDYDRNRLLSMIAELKEARADLSSNGLGEHARLLSLAVTDLESADNWLQRAMSIPISRA